MSGSSISSIIRSLTHGPSYRRWAASIWDGSSSILGEILSHWFDPYPMMDGFDESLRWISQWKVMTTLLGCGDRPPPHHRMSISTQHYHPSMIGKVQFFFETMDPTHDCEMFLSDDRRKGTESSLKDEYIPAMVLKNYWPTRNVEEANL